MTELIERLKACPFCGSEALKSQRRSEWWMIECSTGDCQVEPEALSVSEAEAIRRWNRRTEASLLREAREALEPFANHPEFHAPDDWPVTFADVDTRQPGVTAGDFRRARQLISRMGG